MFISWDEFEDTVFEELLKTGTRLPDVSGTLIENLLLTRTQQAIRQDINRLSYFGNQASNDPNYDSLDGFWTVYYPELVTNDLIPRTDTGSGSALAAGDCCSNPGGAIAISTNVNPHSLESLLIVGSGSRP